LRSFWHWLGRLTNSDARRVLRPAVVSLCVVGTLTASACQDVQHNPLALAVASETYGAVLFSEQLPSVPHLLAEEGLEAEGSAEAEAWWESWRMGGEDGAQLRSLVYPSAIRRLYPVLGEAGVSRFLTRHDERLAAVEDVRSVLASEAVRSALRRATALQAEAWSALSRGEGEDALLFSLHSVDALWEVTPGQVAVDLVERADEALRRNGRPGPYSQEEMIRIHRLLNGAREALGQEDYPLAIRRAYYACQLLGVEPP
jgi:hypothetical protein